MQKLFKNSLINAGIKLAIFILLGWAVYQQVFVDTKFDAVADFYEKNLNARNIILLAFTLFLTAINWGIEALKWQRLINKLERISFFRSFKAILSGVTLAVFTPNRIGEYGGRVFYLKEADKLQAVAATLIGSLSQIIATIIVGIICFTVYMFLYLSFSIYVHYFILFMCGLVVFLLFLIYYNIEIIHKILGRLKWVHKLKKYTHVFEIYSNRELSGLLFLSFLRYFVFTAQYLILLHIYGISGNIGLLGMFVGLIFLVQTIIPSIALAELGVRGNVALFFLGYITGNNLGIVSAAFTLWLLNLIVPAIIGGINLLKVNFVNNKKQSL